MDSNDQPEPEDSGQDQTLSLCEKSVRSSWIDIDKRSYWYGIDRKRAKNQTQEDIGHVDHESRINNQDSDQPKCGRKRLMRARCGPLKTPGPAHDSIVRSFRGDEHLLSERMQALCKEFSSELAETVRVRARAMKLQDQPHTTGRKEYDVPSQVR
ncbi:hypothetical protein B0O80DRAFT_492868 [Mortierella sp. GBAus27b]|nr:hypothetical protein BGX31_001717 [Mortierella sp. GBA43]KAI8363758.1 hypothetical protein B0O80DRAFT_492868 [Mortierella sp. GBAus27b]